MSIVGMNGGNEYLPSTALYLPSLVLAVLPNRYIRGVMELKGQARSRDLVLLLLKLASEQIIIYVITTGDT